MALSLLGGTLRHRMVNEGQMWILQVTNGYQELAFYILRGYLQSIYCK
jgi:hypothetical protein